MGSRTWKIKTAPICHVISFPLAFRSAKEVKAVIMVISFSLKNLVGVFTQSFLVGINLLLAFSVIKKDGNAIYPLRRTLDLN